MKGVAGLAAIQGTRKGEGDEGVKMGEQRGTCGSTRECKPAAAEHVGLQERAGNARLGGMCQSKVADSMQQAAGWDGFYVCLKRTW